MASPSASEFLKEFDSGAGKLSGTAVKQSSLDRDAIPSLDPKATALQVTRLAGRLNASAVSDEERTALLAERKSLLDKHFAEGLTRKEEIRLEYVRWSLGRIEEARHGESLDRLESQIAGIEKLGENLDALYQKLHQLSLPGRRR